MPTGQQSQNDPTNQEHNVEQLHLRHVFRVLAQGLDNFPLEQSSIKNPFTSTRPHEHQCTVSYKRNWQNKK